MRAIDFILAGAICLAAHVFGLAGIGFVLLLVGLVLLVVDRGRRIP